MKLFELIKLNEDAYNPKSFFASDDSVKQALLKGKQIAMFLKQKCAPWLKETNKGKYYVYRGFLKDPKHTAFTKKVRKKRRPKDSSREEHNALDVLIKMCKKKANRTNAVFTTGEKYNADEYGQSYIVIPVGNFNYTWHESHEDWHNEVPWQNLLVKKDPKEKGKALTRETHWAQEWKRKYEKAEKASRLDFPYVKKFFSQFNITIQAKQLDALRLNLERIFEGNGGTMNHGSPNNPFPNTNKDERASAGWWYGEATLIKLAVLKKLYSEILVNADKTQKAAIRKNLLMIKSRLTKNRAGAMFMKNFPNAAEYVEYYKKDEFEHGGGSKLRFTPGKDKTVQLDPNYYKSWCKGLHGDDGTLIAGIKSEVEIMISANSIIAIDIDFYEEIVLPLMQGKTPKLNPRRAEQLMDPRREDWN